MRKLVKQIFVLLFSWLLPVIVKYIYKKYNFELDNHWQRKQKLCNWTFWLLESEQDYFACFKELILTYFDEFWLSLENASWFKIF